MKHTTVLIGNFGSGKSELAINMALSSVKSGKKTVVVDIDLINPYFRISERKSLLEENGIKLIYPRYAMTGVEATSIPPEVYSVFIDDHETVIFDAGGDPTGAIALGQYRANFAELSRLDVFYIINGRRPLSSEVDQNIALLDKIQSSARLSITGLVNNTNLAHETGIFDLLFGYDLISHISEQTDIPIAMTMGTAPVLDELSKYIENGTLDQRYIGKLYPIKRYMHRDWNTFTHLGI